MEDTLVPEVFLDFSSFREARILSHAENTQKKRKNQGKPLEPGYIEKPNFAISGVYSVSVILFFLETG